MMMMMMMIFSLVCASAADVSHTLRSDGVCQYGWTQDCCWGWRRNSRGQCTAVCESGCKHGECVGPDQCRCNAGYTGKTCNQDVNECALRPCKYRCMNTPGSYKCYCLNGHMMTADGSCRNARTCAMANCQYGCAVMKGAVQCQCPSAGLRLSPDGRTCVDVDECETGQARCPRFRKCVNTFSSYICRCHDGFELQHINGKYHCTDKKKLSICYDKPGQKKCKCRPSLNGKGYDCKTVVKVTIEPARPVQVTVTPATISRTTVPTTTAAVKSTAGTTPTSTATVNPTPTVTMTTPVPTSTAMTTAMQTTVAMTTATAAPTTTVPVTTVTTAAATVPVTTVTTAAATVPVTTVTTAAATTADPATSPASPTATAPITTVAMTTATATATTVPVTTTAAATTADPGTVSSSPASPTAPITTVAMATTAATTTALETSLTTAGSTSTLDNRVHRENTQRPRGDVHIPRNENNLFDWDFDVELGNTAEYIRDDPGAGAVRCSFEEGVCVWMLASGDLHWDIKEDPAGGRYLTVPEATNRRSVRGARLTVPLGPPTKAWRSSELCLAFRHRLQGHHIGSLQVFVRKGRSHSPSMWTRTGGHGWRHTQITLWGRGLDDVVLKGDRRQGKHGEISVDDISLRRGSCSDRHIRAE